MPVDRYDRLQLRNVLIDPPNQFSFHSKILEFCGECARVGRTIFLKKVFFPNRCMSTSYRSKNLRSLAGALAVLLLIWLS
ncbi:MAG: hypothetical protein ACO3M6_13995, partial [bacterium]